MRRAHVYGSADAPNTRPPVSLASRGQNAGMLEEVIEGDLIEGWMRAREAPHGHKPVGVCEHRAGRDRAGGPKERGWRVSCRGAGVRAPEKARAVCLAAPLVGACSLATAACHVAWA